MTKTPEPPYREGEHTQMALMAQDVRYMREAMTDIKKDVSDLKQELENKYVTAEAFKPVQNLVYGLVGVVLISVVGAIIAMVVRTPK